jgi:hypothetical protein
VPPRDFSSLDRQIHPKAGINMAKINIEYLFIGGECCTLSIPTKANLLLLSGGAPTMVAAKNANAAALQEARTDYG